METTFTQYINEKIKIQFSKYEKSVIYGQNIVAGSRISGLGAQLDEIDGVRAINSINAENSLIGFGMGLAISGVPSLFLMKQHDFALLGIDQLTNTTNVLRDGRFMAPFIVIMVVVDSGYEGPQASLSSLDEFASLTRTPVHFLSTRETIDLAFKNAETPGLYLLALSQKNMKKNIKNQITEFEELDEAIVYKGGGSNHIDSKLAIVFYGVEISFIEDIQNRLNTIEFNYDVYVMSKLSKTENNSKLFSKLLEYKKIIIIDSGKSEIHFSSEMAWLLMEAGKCVRKFQRRSSNFWSEVSSDDLEFSLESVVALIERDS